MLPWLLHMFDLLFCCRFVTFVACRQGSNVVTFIVDLSHLFSIVTFVRVVTFVAATYVIHYKFRHFYSWWRYMLSQFTLIFIAWASLFQENCNSFTWKLSQHQTEFVTKYHPKSCARVTLPSKRSYHIFK